MITKERLEELFKEGAKIYWLVGKMVLNIHLDSSYYVSDANILCHKRSEDEKNCVEHIENLFETKTQAEWALKYHATRTEELDLPMWEEFITDDKYKYHYGLSFFDFDNYRLIACIPTEDDNTEFIGIDVDGNTELYHWNKATEENYIKACDLCLKLFKGEENEIS